MKKLIKDNKYIIGIVLYIAVSLLIMSWTYVTINNKYAYITTSPRLASIESRKVGTYFKEPIILEKEVIVYVEPEPVETIVDEPIETIEHNIQPINGYFDIFIPSNFTYDDLYKALSSGPHAGLQHLIGAFIDAEQIYGVNSLYLMSTIGYESGWGKYHSGLNNLGGWKTLDGSWRDFSSEYECIMTIAEGLSTSFREDVGGSLYAVTSRYCPDPGYMDMLMQIMQEQQNKILY